MSRDLQRPYAPFPVPNDAKDLPRYIAAELDRIRQAFLAQPVSLTVEETGTAAVTTAINWFDLFIGETPTWDIPGGGFDPVTGIWACPQGGLYTLGLSLEVRPFGGGNKTYYAGVAIDYSGSSVGRFESTDGGNDAIPLGVGLNSQVPILQGTLLKCEATIVHNQFSGDADYKANLQILRVSD